MQLKNVRFAIYIVIFTGWHLKCLILNHHCFSLANEIDQLSLKYKNRLGTVNLSPQKVLTTLQTYKGLTKLLFGQN